MANNKIAKDSLNIWLAVGLVLIIGLIVILATKPFAPAPNTESPGNGSRQGTTTDQTSVLEREAADVRGTIEAFGGEMKQVSLLSPDASSQIRERYRDYVSPELLSEWQAKPELAPGRLVSSPIPDRIDIQNMRKQESSYMVDAEIVEKTSDEQETRRDIALTLNEFEGRWLITAATLAPYETNDGWKSSTDDGLSFRYPDDLGLKYIKTQAWPPEIKSEDSADLSCPVTQEGAPGDSIRTAIINGRDYCIRTRSEGAAGSEYRNYDYATIADSRIITASFALRYPQCANYEEADAKACNLERQEFNLDDLIDRIIRTVRRS